MDFMDIKAVESKLSDVTVTRVPRSELQNSYNNQQQRAQRKQQPQIQISAKHHAQRKRPYEDHEDSVGHSSSSRDLYIAQREREYQKQLSNMIAALASGGGNNASVAAVALQYAQQLQAQWALLQQQANETASPFVTLTSALPGSSHSNLYGSVQLQSHLKYPPSTLSSSNLSSNPSSSTINLPSSSNSSLNNGLTKYAQLQMVIEEMSRDIRPTYTESRMSTERLKRGIAHARLLVHECLKETERTARQ